MAKFLPTGQPVEEIIKSLDNTRKENEARELLKLYEKISKQDPIVWHPGIIGFGEYSYESEKGSKGRSPILAFAPRKQRISLYISRDLENRDELIGKLDKTKQGASWIYVNKLTDIDMDVLEEILKKECEFINNKKD